MAISAFAVCPAVFHKPFVVIEWELQWNARRRRKWWRADRVCLWRGRKAYPLFSGMRKPGGSEALARPRVPGGWGRKLLNYTRRRTYFSVN